MRDVAVTEGNKVSGQIKLGYSVYGYGVGDLVKYVNAVKPAAVKKLLEEYSATYKLTRAVASSESLAEAAKIESGMETFLKEGNFKAFTTTFEDLHGLKQLPGLAVQRLMAKGYGFEQKATGKQQLS
jgi:L-arabinose isomerase